MKDDCCKRCATENGVHDKFCSKRLHKPPPGGNVPLERVGATSYFVHMVHGSEDQVVEATNTDGDTTYYIAHPIVIAAAGLRVVDVKTSTGIYFFLDECCNRTCHPPCMYERANKIFVAQGRKIGDLKGDVKNFKGIGKKGSSGNRLWPFASISLKEAVVRTMCSQKNLPTHKT